MKKILSLSIISLLLIVIVNACSNTNSEESEKITLRVAQIFPDNHPGGIYLEKLSEELYEETDGEITLEVYHNSALGGENDQIEQMMIGDLDMALFFATSIFQSLDPVFAAEELPFIFEDLNHARNAYDGAFGDEVKQMLQEYDFEIVSYWENGFRHFTNNLRPIVEPEDMEGIKFRSSEIPLRIQMFESLDASAITMAFNELFTGLQQGTVDGQENPLETIDSSRFSGVQDYLSLSGHIYNAAPLTISEQSLSRLTEEQKDILFRLAEELKMELRDYLDERSAEIEQELEEQGMSINETNREEFIEAVQPVWETFANENGDQLMNLILESNGGQ